jgi:WD40 repeat protein
MLNCSEFRIKNYVLAIILIAWQFFLSLLQATPARSDVDYSTMALARTITTTGAVSAVAFSPDGKIVAGATASYVLLWNLRGEELHLLHGHTDQVLAIAFSPDGKTVATASAAKDATIKLWDVATGELKQTLTGHKAGIKAIAFSPDGRTLASGSDDKTVILWEVETGKTLNTLAEHDFAVSAVGFARDGTTTVSVSGEFTKRGERLAQVVSWNDKTGYISKRALKEIEAPFAFSPVTELVAAVCNGCSNIKVWDMNNAAYSPWSPSFFEHITVLAFSPNGRVLAAGANKSVGLWNGSKIQDLSADGTTHADKVLAICFSPDGSMIATASADKIVKLWKAS